VLALALLVRLALPAAALWVARDPRVFQYPDSARYLSLAGSLAEDGAFRFQGEPEIYRPPGYPLFLSIGVLAGHPFVVAILLQSGLGTLTVYLTFRVALLMGWSRRSALLSALACAVEPVLLLYGGLLLSETLFVALLMLAIFWLLTFIARPSPGRLVVSAALVSSLAYVRTIAYFLPAWITLVLAVLAVTKRAPRLRPWHALAFLAASGVFVGAWQVRNGLAAGYFGFSTQLDRALYLGVGASVAAAREQIPLGDARRQLEDALGGPDQGLGPTDGETYSRMRRQGLEALGRQPLTYAWIHFQRVLVTALLPGTTGYWRFFGMPQSGVFVALRNGGVAAAWHRVRTMNAVGFWVVLWILMTALTLPYVVLPALALVRRPWPGGSHLGVVLAVGLYYLALAGAAPSDIRLRAPVMPVLSLLAGYELGRRGAG